MIINLLGFAIGLLLLVKGSSYFIKSAASLAKKFNVSEFIIGLTLVAIGTSLPELISSIVASAKNESGLVIGTITGANIANMGLIIGVAAFFMVIKTKEKILNREGYIMIASFILFQLFILNNVISRIEGIVLVIFFIAYTLFIFEAKSTKKSGFIEFSNYFFKFGYVNSVWQRLSKKSKGKKAGYSKIGIAKDVMFMLVSGVAIFFGAKYVVEEAVFFANLLSLPQVVIGALIAIGTTMPEMSVAVTAVRNKMGNIVIGNALGSCLTNTLLVLGISSIINPLNVLRITLLYVAPFMIFLGLILLFFIKSNWEIRKKEGVILILLYVVFMALLIIRVIF
ncbi:MAG: calcium/sodium antiporter [Nanoarchaeota archaeon]|nr:calcium/sodium antiporter [Nanoarchaeota archaeon]MBU1103881.1 calcium/sodium antiporter [Nanoarchaeota archaeon]